MPETPPFFDDQRDVEEILRIAVRKEAESGSDLRDRLSSVASELGISEAALAQATVQWQEEKQVEEIFRLYTEQRRHTLRGLVEKWLVTSAMILGIDFALTRRFTWSILVAGILAAVNLPKILALWWNKPTRHDPEFQKFLARRKLTPGR